MIHRALNHEPGKRKVDAISGGGDTPTRRSRFGWVKQDGSGRCRSMTVDPNLLRTQESVHEGNGRISLTEPQPPVLSLRVRESAP